MSLSVKLEMRHSQQLVMTPQLQQAIKLLQLSNLDLTRFVEGELENNPLLEREETEDSPTIEPASTSERSAQDEPPSTETAIENTGSSEDDWSDIGKQASDPETTFDTEYENVYPDTAVADLGNETVGALAGSTDWSSARSGSTSFSDDGINLEAFVASDISLKDYLAQQLPLTVADPVMRLIGQYLIDLVDEAGYLSVEMDELSLKLGAPVALIEETLKVLQTFEPLGVFSRSLGECLALQLKDQNRYDPQIAALLDNLHLLASHDLARLKKTVGVNMDELSEMIAEIKSLNPKPGLQFGSVHVQPVVPDVLVRVATDGSFLVELNSDTLPRVLVNRSYYTRVSKTNPSEKDKGYLTECLQTANWLVKSLDQRARTILKVAEEIVRQQDGFFVHGVQHLRPLNLKAVANAISMHESTVSRVTSNKYMATNRGIFELKYFFSSSIASSADGEAHSSESVRYRIKQLISGESATTILSDDKIVDMLKVDGVEIARRTVAKYREAMGIRSSVYRRREKRLVEQMENGA